MAETHSAFEVAIFRHLSVVLIYQHGIAVELLLGLLHFSSVAGLAFILFIFYVQFVIKST